MHVLVTLYYLSPATLLWLMPLAYFIDVRKMDVPAVLAELPHSWHLFVLSTLIGKLVRVVTVSRVLASIASRRPPPRAISAPVAVPAVGYRTSSGRAWRRWAARHSQGARPGHGAPGHGLGCSSEPAPKPPIRRLHCLSPRPSPPPSPARVLVNTSYICYGYTYYGHAYHQASWSTRAPSWSSSGLTSSCSSCWLSRGMPPSSARASSSSRSAVGSGRRPRPRSSEPPFSSTPVNPPLSPSSSTLLRPPLLLAPSPSTQLLTKCPPSACLFTPAAAAAARTCRIASRRYSSSATRSRSSSSSCTTYSSSTPNSVNGCGRGGHGGGVGDGSLRTRGHVLRAASQTSLIFATSYLYAIMLFGGQHETAHDTG